MTIRTKTEDKRLRNKITVIFLHNRNIKAVFNRKIHNYFTIQYLNYPFLTCFLKSPFLSNKYFQKF